MLLKAQRSTLIARAVWRSQLPGKLLSASPMQRFKHKETVALCAQLFTSSKVVLKPAGGAFAQALRKP
jgi:hypothetical protein